MIPLQGTAYTITIISSCKTEISVFKTRGGSKMDLAAAPLVIKLTLQVNKPYRSYLSIFCITLPILTYLIGT